MLKTLANKSNNTTDYSPDTEWLKVPAQRVGRGDSALWAAVIKQAADDITTDTTRLKAGGKLRIEAEAAKREAIAWLYTQDFEEVCEMANVNFSSVLMHFKELLRTVAPSGRE